MKLLKFKISKFLFFLFCSTIFYSNGQDGKLEMYQKKYPGHHFIYTKLATVVRINMVKDVPKVTHFYEYEFMILDKNGIFALAEDRIEFSTFEEIKNIEAYSLIPKEKGYKKVEATNFRTTDVEAEGGVFHDGGKATMFMYSSLQVGALRYLSYESKLSNSSFPFGFQFFNSIPVENLSFRIETDSSIHVATQEYFFELADITKTERIEKNKRITEWTSPTNFMIKYENNAPSPRYFAPHILAQLSHYSTKNGRVNVHTSVADLHSQYQINVVEVENDAISPELVKIADSITSNLTVEFDKVKAIYYWVQDHIKYIAFEEGIGGYVPRQPSKIINKRYGDCKDMASLIYAMLKSQNIVSYLTWIGSRDLPYKYTEFASSFADNHMITTYKDGDKIYFLDATNSFQKIEAPTGFIQGKEALIHLGKDQFEIVTVPIQDAEFTKMIDTSYIRLEDRSVIGKSKTLVKGYYHVYLGNYYKSYPIGETDKYVTAVNQKCNVSYKADNAVLQGMDDRDEDLIMKYDWRAANYATTLEDEIYINMVLEKDFVSFGELKEDRVAPCELDNRSSDYYNVILEIPQGYKVQSLPNDIEFKADFLDFSIAYKQLKNTVHMTLHLKLDFLLLQPDYFKQWNEFIKLKNKAISESLLLTKIK